MPQKWQNKEHYLSKQKAKQIHKMNINSQFLCSCPADHLASIASNFQSSNWRGQDPQIGQHCIRPLWDVLQIKKQACIMAILNFYGWYQHHEEYLLPWNRICQPQSKKFPSRYLINELIVDLVSRWCATLQHCKIILQYKNTGFYCPHTVLCSTTC